tara:strand:+ start:48 stop:392 length:345 start_codon:yes stop_codon:yes gene_type:complete
MHHPEPHHSLRRSHSLIPCEQGYKRIQKQQLVNEKKIEDLEKEEETNKVALKREREGKLKERNLFVNWINSIEGKPPDWDAKGMFESFKSYKKITESKLVGKVARKSKNEEDSD